MRLRAKSSASTRKSSLVYTREVELSVVQEYLKKQEKANKSIVFYYRDDKTPREFTNYHIDGRYVKVRSGKGYDISFLIERIRKI